MSRHQSLCPFAAVTTISKMGRECLMGLIVAAALVSITMARAGDSPNPMTGIVTGTVRFTGTVPNDQKITTSDGGTIRHNDLIVDAKSKGLRYVFVQLENAPVQPKLNQAKPAIVDQRDWIFVPRVAAVQDGQ